VYGILNQGVAAEQIKGWRQQAIRDERVRQARRGRATAHGGWWLWRRRPWPNGPLPGKPGVAGQRPVVVSQRPATADQRPAVAGQPPVTASEDQPVVRRAA
jgi:hypothetical protein